MTQTDRQAGEPGAAEPAEAPEPPARRFEDLPPAAQRALREAEARRTEFDRQQAEAQKEYGGRGGKDPARFGDWEIKGIAIDF
ncbi:DUF1674 domain-containing protein [Roseitalea porphyridii]|uniref:DUF1674 domain-containing protein n=1 Tax=Roseitalea porphyridii TaxID=1852022 RepID=A0A4P6V3X4_9HYPH|nr:DUF1674 domain-containing protein [Roseitalea porphyridii]QBK32152.1 DUF1674 domain-containing protein [Roseitalea porphyridii]